ncbi:MAG: NAD(P)-dependent oxidoreductase [Cyanobacteria bacterium P01_A01_bin.84]
MKKLLITGASGFLGWHLCQLASQEWEVYGTYFSHEISIPGVNTFRANLGDFAELQDIFNNIQPEAVIHTAALSQPNFCQTHPQESYSINVEASCNIAGLCADKSIPCIFTSTDLVFDGLNAPYTETDTISPVNIYGEHKVLAENGMLERYPQTAICRMPLMFGNATPTAHSFLQPFLEKLQAGEKLNLFTDEFRTPVSGISAAKGLLLVLNRGISHITHLGGKEKRSRYEFGLLLAEVFDIPQDLINSCRQRDVKMAASRPHDVSLDSSKAFDLGYSPLSLYEELKQVKENSQ